MSCAKKKTGKQNSSSGTLNTICQIRLTVLLDTEHVVCICRV